MILVIDNYDSFTYNLVHLLYRYHDEIKIIKNDEMTIKEIRTLNVDAIVISPGPGTPENSGICIELIKEFYKKIPILGVCLGHQAIGVAFGSKVTKAKKLVHGKKDHIIHDNSGVLKDIDPRNIVVRYHSLVIDKNTISKSLNITSISEMDNEIMSVKHKDFDVFGLQFHPESYGTKNGEIMIKNFVSLIKKESLI